MTIFQICAPTTEAEEKEVEVFYDDLQKAIDDAPKGDVMHIMGDWNAKIGVEKTAQITGKFGLGERNDRGDRLVDFCSQNNLQVINTFFKLHPRRLYTWQSPDRNTRNQIDFILCPIRWKSSVRKATTLSGADCGTDHNLLVADIKLKLKRTNKEKITGKYDLDIIGDEYAVEVKNKFQTLDLEDRDPDELRTEFRDTVTTVAGKHIPRIKKKKVTKWLSETAVKIAEERREAKSKGDQEAAIRLNTAFQKQSRNDKETNLRHKCAKIEQCNRTGRTRDLYREIKTITGIFNARCGTLKGPTGRTVTEEKEVKERCKEYTEELYRKNPGISDVFRCL